MGYAPYGITGNVIQMSNERKRLEKITRYLNEHPECNEYEGKTKAQAEEDIKRIDGFEHIQ